jgi:MFS family permease
MHEHQDAGSAVTSQPEPAGSAWAPLAQRTFRWLWIGMIVSSLGIWMQSVGAQWLVVNSPNAATLVALVQAVTSLPIMLLALPAGVLADSFDRRWLLVTVQAYSFVVSALLMLFTFRGQMPPALLLAFTFALGAGVAVQIPTWQSAIPEVLPRSQLRSAARLDAVGVNTARAVGPAIAGLVIAQLDVPFVFALNAGCALVFGLILLSWNRSSVDSSTGPRERFVPALRAGGRYVRHEPLVRRILMRTVLFIFPAMSIWALLPVIASRQLGLGADGYGALFGALGVGAILGALVLGPIRNFLSTNGIIGAAGVVYAAAIAGIVLAPNFPVALAILLFGGLAWTAMLSTLVAELQLFLPGWVRARGLAVFMVVFTGAQTVAAPVWGLLAEEGGLRTCLFVAAGVMLLGALTGLVRKIPETGHLNREPAVYWGDARMAFEPELEAGPVLITVEYTVAADRQPAFLVATEDLRSSRLRTGATRWELYQDGLRPDRFVEFFSVPSWAEHLRQHSGRLTEADHEVEDAVSAFSDPPPRGDHLLPPQR